MTSCLSFINCKENLVLVHSVNQTITRNNIEKFVCKNKPKKILASTKQSSHSFTYARWLVKRITDYCFTTKRCTLVFLMCERDLAKTRRPLCRRHSVMKHICNITGLFQHCLCSLRINNHQLPPNRKRWLTECWTCQVSVHGYKKTPLRAEAATRPRWTVLGPMWWQRRSPGWGQKVGKYNMRAKSYSLVCVSAARTGGEYTTGIQTPLRRAR